MHTPTQVHAAAVSKWTVILLSSAAFVVQLDGSALNVAIPAIGQSFSVPLNTLHRFGARRVLHSSMTGSATAAGSTPTLTTNLGVRSSNLFGRAT